MLATEPQLVSLIREKADDKGDEEIAGSFASKVASTRNKLTHVESSKPNKPVRIPDGLIWKLRAILCTSSLNQIGIPFDVVTGKIETHEIARQRSWWETR
jgi:hypothetical protein